MIYELNKSHFYKVSHLLTGDLVNIEIKGVVQGYQPGWVFVEHIDHPKTAMIWSKAIDGFYFIGDENNTDFNDYINQFISLDIAPRAKDLGLISFEFSGTSLSWDKTLESVFQNRELHRSKQFTYKYKNIINASIAEIELQNGFEMMEVNVFLLEKKLSNLDFVTSMILDWWDSLDDFFVSGVGFCILYKDQIVSCCISSCVTDDAMGSHTVTLNDYRNHGLAKKLIHQFLTYCRDHGFEPNWDCMEENLGSRLLAESCGYTKDSEYILYHFKLY
ncbi:GNAT family N-acetyltransferase [Chengkuizengella axinellae]|uniref:GNAT family N-acetyltransferase n=1 Tax=Chengkuizengella axinellae TaxID=3064388 RepID=A0ABT9J344_9BACL|nr:GNAT family N-acetyltransferase [Chengkuizengella sp. 2205SS18-9]MDP5276027.1 GNAT family N-acetyltransferase [Chengkuizengella sp. 2205SS18-9]